VKIIPIGADSMGVRSMATFVETSGNVKIIIDPGVALAPERFDLAPHPVEKWMFNQVVERIKLYIRIADIVIITNYNPEHFYDISYTMYHKKHLLLKNPNTNIPAVQRNRAFGFIKYAKNKLCRLSVADNASININGVTCKFSPPFFTGKEKKDTCIMVEIEDEINSLLFSSCVNGFEDPGIYNYLKNTSPDILYLDGPDVSTIKTVDEESAVNEKFRRISSVLEKLPVTELILDHHIKRSVEWEKYITDIEAVAVTKNIKITSASQLRGEEETLLEARRNVLYESDKKNQQNLFV